MRERDNSKNSIARSIEHILSFYICTLRESSLLATGLHRTNRLLSYYHGIVFSPLSLLASLFLLPTLLLRLSLCPLSLYPYPKTILCPSLLHLERYWKQAQRGANLSVLAVASTFYFHPIGRGPLRITPLETNSTVLSEPNVSGFGDSRNSARLLNA